MRKYIVYLYIVVASLIVVSACYPEENGQGADVQLVNTSGKEINRKTQDSTVKSPVFPGADTFQQSCELIQDQAEMLLEEYYHTETADKRLRQIIGELEKLNREWKEKECQQVFGYMIPEIPRTPHKVHKKRLAK